MSEVVKNKSDFSKEEIISLKECRKYCRDKNISDQRMIEIGNSLIGIVDGIINYYLEGLYDG